MMIKEVRNKRFLRYLNKMIAGADTLLDVGCGPGHLLGSLNARMIVALDVHRPYLENMVEHSPLVVPLHADALDISRLFVRDSFTVVTLVDVLEHFAKSDALELLMQAENVAKERVVLFTPRGFFPQEGVDHYGLNGEEYQTHRSGWEPEELEALGYDIIVMKGFHDSSNLAFLQTFGPDHEPIDAILAIKRLNTKGEKT
ncbi:Methyltransferase domain-containing protein [Paenibacillaceae bacterium GAS479]|nr:Methyltransferase domain-containing protein [Paenibacillaceae bacterium GAS479]